MNLFNDLGTVPVTGRLYIKYNNCFIPSNQTGQDVADEFEKLKDLLHQVFFHSNSLGIKVEDFICKGNHPLYKEVHKVLKE